MSIGSLLSMRPTWLLGDIHSLAGNNSFQPRLVAGAAGAETITWLNAQCKVDEDAFKTIQAAPQAVKPYGFLPWRAGGTTYMEIDPNAQLVLTGPLSACTVWAFESNGTTVFAHANANTGVDWADMTAVQKTANLNIKLAAINGIKATYPNVNDVARLVYANTPGVVGAQTYEGYMGFVIGCKPRCGFSLNKVSWVKSRGSNHWTFYFYGYNGVGEQDRVLWALN